MRMASPAEACLRGTHEWTVSCVAPRLFCSYSWSVVYHHGSFQKGGVKILKMLGRIQLMNPCGRASVCTIGLPLLPLCALGNSLGGDWENLYKSTQERRGNYIRQAWHACTDRTISLCSFEFLPLWFSPVLSQVLHSCISSISRADGGILI